MKSLTHVSIPDGQSMQTLHHTCGKSHMQESLIVFQADHVTTLPTSAC